MNTRKRIFIASGLAAIVGASANAQVSAPVFSGGGTLHTDSTVFVVGQLAIGPIAGLDKVDQGAVPCWLVEGGCFGDLDGDADIDLDDLLIVLAGFGQPGPGAPGDVDGDGDCDLDDLLLTLARFGDSCV